MPVLTLSPPNALIGHDLRSSSSNGFPGSRAFTEPIGGPNMGNSVHAEPVIRFQDFLVNLETGELWKAGIRLKLQDQPFKVLVTLLQRPGQVVSREELQQLIWPQESFGDFDHAINLAIAKLRATLGDSADVPHLIETLPRRGYRFIAPVEGLTSMQRDVSPRATGHAWLTTKWIWVTAGAAALIFLSTTIVPRLLRRPGEPSSSRIEMVPAVSMQGKQGGPAISPDGKQLVFSEFEPPHSGMYITLVNGGRPLQLTDYPTGYPTWSPDGSQIAFSRYSGNQKSFYIMPALGGSEHRVYTGPVATWPNCSRLDWSPDGKSLLFPESIDEGTRSRLTILSLSDLSSRPLTSPRNQQFDCEPAFSPDGSTIAFVRGSMGGFLGDLFVLRLSGGEPVRVTSGNSGGAPAWTPDGSEIVFSSPMGGLRTLWRISASGGTPRPVGGAVEDAWRPAISRRGNQLIYTQNNWRDTIWRLDLKDDRHIAGPPVRLISSRGSNWKPSFSPDGKKIAFESDRSGYLEIWMCDSDGSNCTQLTSLHGQSGTARWSPDGRYIAFESISQDFYGVYLLEVAGGTPRLLPTFLDANNGAVNWSRDGQWIYFYSAHERGPLQLWKLPFQGGAPVRVTKNGGVYAIESYDRRFVYYAKFRQPGLWKMPLEGGEETRVLDQPTGWNNWALSPTGIYFLNDGVKPNGRIEFFDFATRRTIPLFTLEKPIEEFGGPALSPDGKSLLFSQAEVDESHVMLIKNFH